MKNLLLRTARLVARRTPAPLTTLESRATPRTLPFLARADPRTAARPFTSTFSNGKGIQPDSAEPKSPNTQPHASSGSAAQLSDPEYHELADQYLEELVLAAEEFAEANGTEGFEVEFSVR